MGLQSSKVKGIPKGSRGVLVSCVLGQEKKGGREALAILSESFEALNASHGSKESGETKKEGERNDISSLLADEIADLKDRDKQDFSIREVGISALVYIECKYENGPQPSEIVMHALETAKETGQNKARICNRFYPIDYTSTSQLDDIKDMGKIIAKDHFPTSDGTITTTFSVDCERRAHPPSLQRMDVINAYASAIDQPPYKVDLNNPEKTVLVNVIKGTCGAAVVQKYRALSKFNLRELTLSSACNEKDGDSS